MILISFTNCAIGSLISIFKNNRVVAALKTDLDIIDAVYVPVEDCKYRILIQHKDYKDFEIDWNPMLDGRKIYVEQEQLSGVTMTSNSWHDKVDVTGTSIIPMSKKFIRDGVVGFTHCGPILNGKITAYNKDENKVFWLNIEDGNVVNHHSVGNIVWEKWNRNDEIGFGITLYGDIKSITRCEVETPMNCNFYVGSCGIDWVIGCDLAQTTSICLNFVDELESAPKYKFQKGHLLRHKKNNRRGAVVDIKEHDEFGTYYILDMEDDWSIQEAYHEDDLEHPYTKTEEPENTGYGIWENKRYMIQDLVASGMVFTICAAVVFMVVNYENVSQIINRFVETFQK